MSEDARTGRFSVPLCLAGAVLLALCLTFGLVTGYFLAWGIDEGGGSSAAKAAAWVVLVTFVGYALAVAPALWSRARSAAARAAILAPHAGFVAVGVTGLVNG